MVSPFVAYLADHYVDLRSLALELGRRRAKLRLLAAFWALPAEEKARLALLAEDPQSLNILSDALDEFNNLHGEEEVQVAQYVNEASIAGVVVRTDFSDDTAWERFRETLLQAEKDLEMPIDEMECVTSGPTSGSIDHDEGDADDSEEESENEEMTSSSQSISEAPSSASPASLFAFLSPPPSSLRARIVGMSNLGVLRLVNEVDVVRTLVQPPGIQRTISQSSGHRLSGLHGFVEAYSGPLVWVYDTRSNADCAARVVSQCADNFGAMTADSWRARASFLPELQLSLFSGAVKIDFGGLDRWDHGERQRNIAETEALEL